MNKLLLDKTPVNVGKSEMTGLAKPQLYEKAPEFVVMTSEQRFRPTPPYKAGVPKFPFVVVCSCQWECLVDTEEQGQAVGTEHLRKHGR